MPVPVGTDGYLLVVYQTFWKKDRGFCKKVSAAVKFGQQFRRPDKASLEQDLTARVSGPTQVFIISWISGR